MVAFRVVAEASPRPPLRKLDEVSDGNVGNSSVVVSAVLSAPYNFCRPDDSDEGAILGKVEVSNEELHTIRDAMRELHRMVEALGTGELEKVVLTHRNQMRAVVVSVDEYARLRRGDVDDTPIAA